jgi:hypothetical protein
MGPPVLVVVGPCAAGKSTLVAGLDRLGIPVVAVAQEHSRVPGLWRRPRPAALVYLAARWPTVHARRPYSFGHPQYLEQLGRLAEARAAADLIVHTDGLAVEAVRAVVLAWWRGRLAERAGTRPR